MTPPRNNNQWTDHRRFFFGNGRRTRLTITLVAVLVALLFLHTIVGAVFVLFAIALMLWVARTLMFGGRGKRPRL